MAGTIVVPLDQSENAERALPVAQALARQFDAQLQLVSVFEIPPEYIEWAGEHAEDEPWIKHRWNIEAYLADVASRLRPLNVSTLVLTGIDPAFEVHEAVAAIDDVILVMSTQGRSGIKRLVLGSKAARAVQLASYPLVVVPAECKEQPASFSRLLLPLDGSSFAEHALNVTLELFTGEELTAPAIHLLRVVDQIYVDNEYDEVLRIQLFDEAHAYLNRIGEQLRERGCEVSWEVEESFDVANRIVTIAHMAEVDLISLATHGRSGFSRFFLGSVADAVLRTATKPVLIIRPSEEVVENAPETRSLRARLE